ncbi:Maintenance of mitochondrial morphology protein 1 [Sphaceloma murrayae]|uniref:Maintenance of mitochondrial morphology protein 1 n=1 Tax=Sphaceloma murrayae TaxID=2082308 RepID=A0A2K1QKW7_9PEZI|nr:Maintenance of mitochondrial morphology protein 1 [Sphaceloma murrayae]
MSKAKQASASASSGSVSSGGSFAQGFLLGQLTLALILFFFIKFFLFGDSPSADTRAAARAAARRQRTLSHSKTLRKKRSSATLGARHVPAVGPATSEVLTTDKILEKTYYTVDGHQPESLDWFNVLIAQTIAQLRADALADDAVLSSLTRVLNGGSKPDFLDEIKVTEISLGEEFPIFSNCRVIPVDEDGTPVKPTGNRRGFLNALRDSRLQAHMDVDLSDVVTLGIETKLILNYPKPFVAVLPVALSVSVVRFSGTLSLSFTPSQVPPTPDAAPGGSARSEPASTPPNQATHSPTTLTFAFLDDYRLDLSVHSLIGSRSRLQDVPKIAQLVEQRIHQWFDERCVEPRFQQIVLPSLWPRKKNVRGGGDDGDIEDKSASSGLGEAVDDADLLNRPGTSPQGAQGDYNVAHSADTQPDHYTGPATPTLERPAKTVGQLNPNGSFANGQYSQPGDAKNMRKRPSGPRSRPGSYMLTDLDDLASAGADIRAAEARARAREMRRSDELGR